MSPESRIAIVGAGAAGLTLALVLRDKGFTQVTVFEASERIGGKCKSLTFGGRSFDLGANYVTSSYTEVRGLARRFGMSLFSEAAGHAIDPATGALHSLLRATTRQASLLAVGWAALRFMWLRWQLRRKLAPQAPGFAAANADPALCAPFTEWLEKNRLQVLEPMFSVPVTLMGYSRLSEIPAAYALTYMNLRSFLDLVLFALDPPLRQWPKRFTLGYERLLERIAAEVTVLRGARISRIERGDTVTIDFELAAADGLRQGAEPCRAEFDALVLACPLLPPVLEGMLTLSEAERALLDQVEFDPFVVATYAVSSAVPVQAVSFCFPRPPLGQPYVVTRQFADNPLLSLYTRVDRAGHISREQVLENNSAFLRRIGASDPQAAPFTYDKWPYFPHVTSSAMRAGFYTRLEALQGQQRTYYAGGLMAFELVETIAAYSRHLVTTYFQEQL